MNHQTKLSLTLQHLKRLISFDTQNPPRNITASSDIFLYLQSQLTDFDFSIIDAGNGCLALLAERGTPDKLFNFHIDTVPVAANWNSNPFEMVVRDDKVYGLGSCDIKGASACMLSAVNQTKGDVALLFSSDEEHGNSEAVKAFIATKPKYKSAIVAEPTQALARVAHRGIQSARAIFKGVSGHASESRALYDNAIHKASHWMTAVLAWVKANQHAYESLVGMPFNIGKIEGGIKANMIADHCELAFGFRPLPGQNAQKILEDIVKMGNLSTDSIEIHSGFSGPTLPAANQPFEQSIIEAKNLAEKLGISIGEPVNFWTEASLFSQAGLTTLVYGPGNIEQAHTANEWVNIDQLVEVEKQYCKIIAQSSQESL
ncbi:MAG: acetylornithine deacetylase [Gammaproteobacteria bacterium]|nr:acetylornithine deacetylase [Gammaproteobacteria bacterium]